MFERLAALLLLSVLSAAVQAQQFAGSGDRLQMLKKIQGRWQSSCYPTPEGVAFRQDQLRFNFTHLQLQVATFADGSCSQRLADHSYTFSYSLGATLITEDGERAFTIDLRTEAAAPLHLVNLISYRRGSLYLGQVHSEEPHQRLSQLNYAMPFTRP